MRSACAAISPTGRGCGKVADIICRVSRTVSSGRRPPVCNTAPISEPCTAARGVRLRTEMLPVVGVVRPRMRSKRVVLPAPLVPKSPTISPWEILNETSLSARTGSEPLVVKVLLTPETFMAGVCFALRSVVLIPKRYSGPARMVNRICHENIMTSVMAR